MSEIHAIIITLFGFSFGVFAGYFCWGRDVKKLVEENKKLNEYYQNN